MRILAIMGSPHKGNTLELTYRFEKEIEALGDVDFEYIHLRNDNLQPCKGCFQCFIQGEAYCPLKDDRDEIAHRLDEADGVILVSPVYSMHVSYLFKQFVDRFAYNFHRPRYFGKYAIAIAATGGIGLDETIDYLKGVATGWGFEYVDGLGYIAPPRNTPMQVLVERRDRTGIVARKFYTAMKEQKPRGLKLVDHIHFKAMRAVYGRMETMSPFDYAYWREKGWLADGCAYFTEHAKVSLFKRLIADFIAWNMGRGMDRQLTKLSK